MLKQYLFMMKLHLFTVLSVFCVLLVAGWDAQVAEDLLLENNQLKREISRLSEESESLKLELTLDPMNHIWIEAYKRRLCAGE